jgi:hypothetical protein
MTEVKPREERLKETITLLNKLPEVGIPKTHPLFLRVKDLMTGWVNMGPVVSERIDFGSHWGDLTLPVKAGRVASLDMKVKRPGRT